MKNLDHLSLPDDVYDLIERRARVSGRSPAEEAAEVLARIAAADLKEAALLEEIRRGHEEMATRGLFASADDILAAVEWGRE